MRIGRGEAQYQGSTEVPGTVHFHLYFSVQFLEMIFLLLLRCSLCIGFQIRYDDISGTIRLVSSRGLQWYLSRDFLVPSCMKCITHGSQDDYDEIDFSHHTLGPIPPVTVHTNKENVISETFVESPKRFH